MVQRVQAYPPKESEVIVDSNPNYLIQVEGWRGAVRQAPAAQPPKPVTSPMPPPIVSMAVRVIGRVGNKLAA